MVIPKIRVRIGEWDFASTSEPQGSIELKVVEKIVHPKYNFFTYEYDLALVKLEHRIEFRENIIPICLAGNDDLLVCKYLSSCQKTQQRLSLRGVKSVHYP